ncbi:hypothetical protein BV22DRAFT_1052448 [Leucogyrophana mollusca]|uniref:Uncharacterized protein n=1 Tax=Leucogyrophana mollusca TaxID=85980 RepID=A0ACB8AVW8_9AGAM|nr:hypothetical protein BV22DRAFT_1052448 [Leucogyrophana mollusca]
MPHALCERILYILFDPSFAMNTLRCPDNLLSIPSVSQPRPTTSQGRPDVSRIYSDVEWYALSPAPASPPQKSASQDPRWVLPLLPNPMPPVSCCLHPTTFEYCPDTLCMYSSIKWPVLGPAPLPPPPPPPPPVFDSAAMNTSSEPSSDAAQECSRESLLRSGGGAARTEEKQCWAEG